jgi:thymidylate synthase
MTSHHDEEYLKLVKYALETGVRKPNRTGVDTIGVFSYQMRFDLGDGTIPLLTTKKMHTRAIIHEILWYLQGADNVKYLNDNNVTIWNEWAKEDGSLGPVYGYQWRKWPTYKPFTTQKRYVLNDEDTTLDVWYCEDKPVDQIARIVDKLKNNPLDRRLIVSAWNVADIDKMALPPCHYTFQFYVKPMVLHERILFALQTYQIPDDVPLNEVEKILDANNVPKYELSLMLNQRSCDIGLGVPFNIVQYSILLRMFCEVANMVPGEFIWNGGDTHVYVNHISALEEQMTRPAYHSPTFKFARKIDDIDCFKYEDFIIEDYQSHPTLKMEVAV